MSGLIVVHDGPLMGSLWNKGLTLGMSPGQDLFAYHSSNEALGAYGKWKDVSTIVVHKDLHVEGGAIRFVEALERRMGVGRGDLPFCVVVTSGEANDQGVSSKVMHDIRADVLVDFSVDMGVLPEVINRSDSVMTSRLRNSERGRSVIVYTWGRSRTETNTRSRIERDY